MSWEKIIGMVILIVALMIVIPSFDDIFINIPLATILLPIVNNWIEIGWLSFLVSYGLTYLIGIILLLIGLMILL